MQTAKLRKVGNSTGLVLTKQLLESRGWHEGDELLLQETPEGILIRRRDPDFEKKLMIARETMAKYSSTMEELAK